MVIVFVCLMYFIYNGLSLPIGLVYAVPALCYNNPFVYRVQNAPTGLLTTCSHTANTPPLAPFDKASDQIITSAPLPKDDLNTTANELSVSVLLFQGDKKRALCILAERERPY